MADIDELVAAREQMRHSRRYAAQAESDQEQADAWMLEAGLDLLDKVVEYLAKGEA